MGGTKNNEPDMRTNIAKDIQRILTDANAPLDKLLHGRVDDDVDHKAYLNLWSLVDLGVRPIRLLDQERQQRFHMKFMMRVGRNNTAYKHRLGGKRWRAPIIIESASEMSMVFGELKDPDETLMINEQ